jgi:hypothetical protein
VRGGRWRGGRKGGWGLLLGKLDLWGCCISDGGKIG